MSQGFRNMPSASTAGPWARRGRSRTRGRRARPRGARPRAVVERGRRTGVASVSMSDSTCSRRVEAALDAWVSARARKRPEPPVGQRRVADDQSGLPMAAADRSRPCRTSSWRIMPACTEIGGAPRSKPSRSSSTESSRRSIEQQDERSGGRLLFQPVGATIWKACDRGRVDVGRGDGAVYERVDELTLAGDGVGIVRARSVSARTEPERARCRPRRRDPAVIRMRCHHESASSKRALAAVSALHEPPFDTKASLNPVAVAMRSSMCTASIARSS